MAVELMWTPQAPGDTLTYEVRGSRSCPCTHGVHLLLGGSLFGHDCHPTPLHTSKLSASCVQASLNDKMLLPLSCACRR